MSRRLPKFEYYEATDGWRWRLRASNGRVRADSGEAYATEQGVRRACWTLQEEMLFASRPLEIVKVDAAG